MAGGQLPDPWHPLQPEGAAQAVAGRGRRCHRRLHPGAHGRHRCPGAALRRWHLHPHRLRVSGVVVNREGERFYDEGEDFWPKRYAIWGRLVAGQPGQAGLQEAPAAPLTGTYHQVPAGGLPGPGKGLQSAAPSRQRRAQDHRRQETPAPTSPPAQREAEICVLVIGKRAEHSDPQRAD